MASPTTSEGEKMSELQSLALRARDLNQSVDWWNTAMIWGLVFAAIAAIAVVVATRIALVRTKELAETQNRISGIKEADANLEQQRMGKELAAAVARGKEADARIAEAQRGVAEANTRATKAQESLALAEQHSAEANAKAEGFRLDIAKANERAASANETAERERLARLQLEARLAPRVLTPDQQRLIAANLRLLGSFAAQMFWYSDITEVTRISDNIGSTLVAAGWTTAGAHAQGGVIVSGIVVAVGRNATANLRTAADRLVSELVRNGVPATFTPTPLEDIPAPGMSFGNTVPNPQIRIMIGTK